MKLELPYVYQFELDALGVGTLLLKLKPQEAFDLASRIQDVLEKNSESRLRLDIQNGVSWMLYVKLKEGESRAMLAHPTHEEWVGTLAFERPILTAWMTALSGKAPFDSAHHFLPSRMNNLRIKTEILL